MWVNLAMYKWIDKFEGTNGISTSTVLSVASV
jgi:hypothetical protein